MNEYKKVRLGDVCILEKGSQIDTSLLDNSKPYRYINGGIKESGYYDHFNTSGESVLISEGGASCGYINYVNEDFWCGCHCYRLHDINLFPKYLYHALKGNQDRIMALRTGSAMPNIQKSTIQKFELNIHENTETQKQIAATLDKVTKIISENNRLLEKYDLLIKSRFIEMFGDNPVENGKWKVEKLGNLVTVTSSKRIYAEEQSTEGIPFLRISDLVSKINGIDSNDLYIPEEKYHEFVENGLVPNVDDILVTSRGTLGLCYTITADDKFYFQDGMITWLKFSNHESILSIFLSYLFNVILKQKIDLKTNGATVKYVSISELKNLEIPLPPLELQQQFATFVQQIDKSKFLVQKSLEKAETLYKSLMQEYFG